MCCHTAVSTPIRHVLWGSELSPFALKVRAQLQWARIPFRFLPVEGGRLENARVWATIEVAKARRKVVRFPETTALDEYPLVPYLVEDGRRVFYDSSALGRWVDATTQAADRALFPADPVLRFAAQLIDEAFDEFGLYMLHHHRWVVSAADNNAGERLAREFRSLLPARLEPLLARRFSRRQVRRLPYLFSVAPLGFSIPGLPRERVPPARAGFPATHALLEEAWHSYLDAMEGLLSSRPFLLGERFTIADASAFGHLGGSFIDPSAKQRLRAHAPRTYAWLEGIWRGAHVDATGELALDASIAPLLRIVSKTFVPLMQQNESAYVGASRAGETMFNERAFNRGRALYEGELLGRPFRSVAKTFQVQVFRELRGAWGELAPTQRATFEALAGEMLR